MNRLGSNLELKCWPKRNLGCLSESAKTQSLSKAIHSNVSIVNSNLIIDINKYSSIHKIDRILSFIFKFINLSRKRNVDHIRCARLYLLKNIQSQYFQKEISFLQTHFNKVNNAQDIPNLVKNLNLYIDNDGLI